MAVPVWQATSFYQPGAAGTSAVIALPSPVGGVLLNDIVVITVYKENTAAVTPPAGFTEKTPTPSTTATSSQHTFWKRTAGGESGNVTFSWTGSVWRTASADLIRGCITTGDPFAEFTTAQTNSSVTTLNISLAATSPNTLLFWAGTQFNSVGNTWTPPSGFTERNDNIEVSHAYKSNAAGGASGTLTGTSSTSGQMTAVLATLADPSYVPPVAFGAIGAKSAGGTTTLSIAHPASVAAADLLIAGRATWHGAADCDPLDEAGWTNAGEKSGGVGTTADAHTSIARADYKIAAGGETGSVTFDQGGTAGATGGGVGVMARYSKDSAQTWDIASATASDDTHGTNRAVTTAAMDLAVGDVLVALAAIDTDTSLAGFASPAFAASRTFTRHVTIAAPRNGTTAHTVHPDGTGGTVVDGSAFTPTSGRLLLCVVEGAVTSTTPSGWTLPTNGSAINNTGLYVFHRTASATSADQVATTHNGSDYPVVFDFYEFPAGSTFAGSATATGVANSGAGPTLSGLTGTNWTAGITGQGSGSIATPQTWTWNLGTEEVDTSVIRGGSGPTDGYGYSLTYTADNTAASQAYAATYAIANPTTIERLVIAVSVPATITFGTVTRRTSGAGVTTGSDGNIELVDSGPITAGSGTVPVIFSFTTTTTQCGPVVILRLRQGTGTTSVSQSIATSWNVVGQITDTVAESWNIRAEITDTVAESWAVETSVTQSVAEVWSVKQAITDAVAQSWNLQGRITQNLAQAWNTRAVITDTVAQSWAVKTPAAQSVVESWKVRQAVNQNSAQLWNVGAALTAVTSSVIESWRVREAVTKSSAQTWNLRAQVISSSMQSWYVRQSITDTTVQSWAVKTLLIQSVAESWRVGQSIISSSVQSWAVKTSLAQSVAESWRVRQSITPTVAEAWDLRVQAISSSVQSWAVKTSLTDTVAQSWRVREVITKSSVQLWNVAGLLTTITDTMATSWKVVGRITSSSAQTWAVKTTLSKTTAESWAVKVAVGKTTAESWRVREATTKSVAEIWHVRAWTTAASLSFWAVRVSVIQSQATTWNVIAALAGVTKNVAQIWRVRAVTSSAVAEGWNVAARAAQSLSEAWQVRQGIQTLTSVSWRVRAQTVAVQATFWHVVGQVTANVALVWRVYPESFYPGGPWSAEATPQDHGATFDVDQDIGLGVDGWTLDLEPATSSGVLVGGWTAEMEA